MPNLLQDFTSTLTTLGIFSSLRSNSMTMGFIFFFPLCILQNYCFVIRTRKGMFYLYDVIDASACGGGFYPLAKWITFTLSLSVTCTIPSWKCSMRLIKWGFYFVEDYRSHKKRVTSNSFGIWFNLCLLEMEGESSLLFYFFSAFCVSVTIMAFWNDLAAYSWNATRHCLYY